MSRLCKFNEYLGVDEYFKISREDLIKDCFMEVEDDGFKVDYKLSCSIHKNQRKFIESELTYIVNVHFDQRDDHRSGFISSLVSYWRSHKISDLKNTNIIKRIEELGFILENARIILKDGYDGGYRTNRRAELIFVSS